SRARNRSPDPVVSCFFGRIAPSDAATESCFSIRGNRENELQASKASDTETLQSQVNKAAKKRLSLSGLEILHGRLGKNLLLSLRRLTRTMATFPESYINSGYEQHCLGTPNSGRSYARRAHASGSCARSWMSPSVGSILGEQGQQPADECRLCL